MEQSFHCPPVSVIVPARDAEDRMHVTLSAILSQEYAGRFEVLVADGSTTEETAKLLRQHFPTVQRVLNPAHTISTGFNKALERATGKIIVRCDAYALLPPHYIQQAVETLIRTGADGVGGRQYAQGETFIECAIAIGQRIPIGIGNASHRLDRDEGPTDTAYLGVYRRDVLEGVGGFDPALLQNEDYEINLRIRRAGGIIWYDPTLVVMYQPRSGFLSLGKQYFGYGKAKLIVLSRYPSSVRCRQLIPPLLFLGMVASIVDPLITASLRTFIFPFSYIFLLLGAAVWVGVSRGTSHTVLLPLVLPIMHLSWAAGFLYALLTKKEGIYRFTRWIPSGKAAARTPQHLFPFEVRSVRPPIELARLVEQERALEIGTESDAKADEHISVVILTWNSAGKIEPCLESLQSGTRVPDEIIVVDNGSTDNTRAIVAGQFPSVQIIRNASNRGVARARNQGLAAARGTYLLVLDDDTIVQPEALVRLVAVLETNPTVALCGPQLLSSPHEPISVNLTFPTLSYKLRQWGMAERRNGSPWDNNISGRMRDVDYVIGACQLIRRAALDEIGLYDEHIFYGPEDIDLCLRLRQAGWRVIFQPAAQVIHAEQRRARSVFSPIGRKHTAALGYYFWKHRYGLSRSQLSKRLLTFSPVSHSL